MVSTAIQAGEKYTQEKKCRKKESIAHANSRTRSKTHITFMLYSIFGPELFFLSYSLIHPLSWPNVQTYTRTCSSCIQIFAFRRCFKADKLNRVLCTKVVIVCKHATQFSFYFSMTNTSSSPHHLNEPATDVSQCELVMLHALMCIQHWKNGRIGTIFDATCVETETKSIIQIFE